MPWNRMLVVVLLLGGPLIVPPAAWTDDPKPDRAAFLAEVLDAKPTPVTPKFDDYTRGSYHVEKADLLKGLTEEAGRRKLGLRAALITGPMPLDPLWSYYVTVFLKEGDQVRVNHLVMPHARITGKSTGLISADRYDKWLAAALATGLPEKVVAAKGAADAGELPKEGEYQLLLAVWETDGKGRRLCTSDLVKNLEKTGPFAEVYNGLLKDLKKTYPAD
jgi:hypothetical protein